MGWEAGGDGAPPLPTVTAGLLGEPGHRTGTRELPGTACHPIICPAQLNHALGSTYASGEPALAVTGRWHCSSHGLH